MAVGQRHGAHVYALLAESVDKRLSRLLTTAVPVGVKSQIDGSRTVAKLPNLACIEMGSQRAGDVAKTGFPQRGVVEQALDQNHFRMPPDLIPGVQAALCARQKPVRR